MGAVYDTPEHATARGCGGGRRQNAAIRIEVQVSPAASLRVAATSAGRRIRAGPVLGEMRPHRAKRVGPLPVVQVPDHAAMLWATFRPTIDITAGGG